MDITITLTDVQYKALAYAMADPQDWIQNFVNVRCEGAIDEIFQMEIQRMLADPSIQQIPADREAVVLAADIMSAADRNKALLEQSKNGPVTPS